MAGTLNIANLQRIRELIGVELFFRPPGTMDDFRKFPCACRAPRGPRINTQFIKPGVYRCRDGVNHQNVKNAAPASPVKACFITCEDARFISASRPSSVQLQPASRYELHATPSIAVTVVGNRQLRDNRSLRNSWSFAASRGEAGLRCVGASSPESKKHRVRKGRGTPPPGDWSAERAVEGRSQRMTGRCECLVRKRVFPVRVLSGLRVGSRSN
jgi:hypothetical protein